MTDPTLRELAQAVVDADDAFAAVVAIYCVAHVDMRAGRDYGVGHGQHGAARRRAETMTYYHASPRQITALRPARLCVTCDRDAALEYASAHLYEVSISGRIADEADIRAMARELCPDSPYTSGWELLEEHPQIEAALIEAGYAGACYDDMTPDNASEHETTVLFVASESATLTEVSV